MKKNVAGILVFLGNKVPKWSRDGKWERAYFELSNDGQLAQYASAGHKEGKESRDTAGKVLTGLKAGVPLGTLNVRYWAIKEASEEDDENHEMCRRYM